MKNDHQIRWNMKKTLKTVKKHFNNAATAKEGMDGQKWRRLKRITIMYFFKIVELNSFQS